MKTEFAYHNEKFWQPSKRMIENGVTILALLQAGWTFDTLIDHGHLVELEDSIDNRIRFDWGVDLRTPKNLVYDKPCPVDFSNVMSFRGEATIPRCGNVQCVECYGPPEYTDEQIDVLNAARGRERELIDDEYELTERALKACEHTNLVSTWLASSWTIEQMVDAGLASKRQRAKGELTVKVDTSAVSEAIRQVLEVSDTSRMLIELLARRDAHGKAKYGTSLDRTDLSLVDWLQHQTEELLDGAGYAQAAKREAEKLLALEAPLRKLIGHLQENPPRIHNPSLRALVDLLQ